jgi:Arc/MetJ-type ribon-helix-helix transcriptional regulator
MPQITLRLPDDLLDRIEDATGPETSRSEWLRNAARQRLDDGDDDLDRVRQEHDVLEERIEDLEEEFDRSLLDRLLR